MAGLDFSPRPRRRRQGPPRHRHRHRVGRRPFGPLEARLTDRPWRSLSPRGFATVQSALAPRVASLASCRAVEAIECLNETGEDD